MIDFRPWDQIPPLTPRPKRRALWWLDLMFIGCAVVGALYWIGSCLL